MRPRYTIQQHLVAEIEYGEALLTALKLKAERQVELISASQPDELTNFCRLILDIQVVQQRVDRERYRLSLLKT